MFYILKEKHKKYVESQEKIKLERELEEKKRKEAVDSFNKEKELFQEIFEVWNILKEYVDLHKKYTELHKKELDLEKKFMHYEVCV